MALPDVSARDRSPTPIRTLYVAWAPIAAVYEAKNRPGRELLRGARTLPTHMTRGKEDGARGEGPDSAERPHQRAEQEGAPDGFLLRRFDGQDECPRD